MKQIGLYLLVCGLLLLSGCGITGVSAPEANLGYQEQAIAQLLNFETTAPPVETTTVPTTTVRTSTTTTETTTTVESTAATTVPATEATTVTTTVTTKPLALAVRALWIPASDLNTMLAGQNEAGFRRVVQTRLKDAKTLGINTIFLHVRSFGDAYYNSKLFPRAAGWSTGQHFDPLAVFLKEAHALGLQLHAWVNPLRCQTIEQMAKLGTQWQTKKWVASGDLKMRQVGTRWYLDPAYAETRALIFAGVTEILSGYQVDGIHIDDYFYPTTDPTFDAVAYGAFGKGKTLAAWRTNNINLLVAGMYGTVKASGAQKIFSVSPAGSVSYDNQMMYADVAKWCSTAGYADWMIPQLYFGFFNEAEPFIKSAKRWTSMVTSDKVKLIFGIATYKIGQVDTFAGTGSQEWITDTAIPARQILFSSTFSGVSGVALFSSASTNAVAASERKAIQQALAAKKE